MTLENIGASFPIPAPATIAICGSMTFIDEMEEIGEGLRHSGYEVHTPEREEEGVQWDDLDEAEALGLKRRFILDYFQVIAKSDCVLIANFEKRGIPGYIGANSLMEAACARAFGKKLFLLYPPGEQDCQLEILALIDGTLPELWSRV